MKLIVKDDSRIEEEKVLYKPGPCYTVYRESNYGDGRVFIAVASEIDDPKTANLFSAAPDLLEACNFFLENWKMDKFSESLQKIKEAVSKAEGRN